MRCWPANILCIRWRDLACTVLQAHEADILRQADNRPQYIVTAAKFLRATHHNGAEVEPSLWQVRVGRAQLQKPSGASCADPISDRLQTVLQHTIVTAV